MKYQLLHPGIRLSSPSSPPVMMTIMLHVPLSEYVFDYKTLFFHIITTIDYAFLTVMNKSLYILRVKICNNRIKPLFHSINDIVIDKKMFILSIFHWPSFYDRVNRGALLYFTGSDVLNVACHSHLLFGLHKCLASVGEC